MKIKLRYLIHDTDRHGNDRYYVRVPGQKKVRILAAPLTPAFMDAYRSAIAVVQPDEIKPKSFRWLCVNYLGSNAFKRNDVSTRSWQRRHLDAICKKHGHKPLSQMESRHVRKIRNEIQDTPAAANGRMKALRAMFGWANEEEIYDRNPTLGVKNIRYTTKGHHSWTPEEMEQYYRRHPLGTKARLGIDLIRYTTGRREDIPRFGRQHFKGGRIKYRQGKNDERSPIDIDMPCHAALRESIDAYFEANPAAKNNMTFLTTESGKPFTTNGFGNKFKDWCRQANLPRCSAHGVRKFTAIELAENDATPHQIGAITGHRSLKEVERYTRDAQRRRLADAAMAKLPGGDQE